MKRFIQNSCSWLAMLFTCVAFAISSNASAQTEFTFEREGAANADQTFTKNGISITGFGYNCAYVSYTGYPCINLYGDHPMTVSAPGGTIEKIEMYANNLSSTSTNFKNATANTGSLNVESNAYAEWTGSASEVVFNAGNNTDVYIYKVVVYATGIEGGGEEGGEATAIEMPLTGNTNGIQDGVTYNFTSRSWNGGSTNLYGNGDRSATWGTIFLDCYDKEIVKVELTCANNSYSEQAAKTIVETENLQGTMSTNGGVAVWEGSAHNLTFSSTDDIDVVKVVVYVKGGEVVVKDCSIDVDHFADNCKPGEVQSISKWITLYMQANTATTSWTGSSNCPEGVTFTTEAGEEIPVDQFNYWAGSDQIGVNLYEEITTPGTYTLHIPEGLVAFEGGKFNKEITAVWTIKSSTPVDLSKFVGEYLFHGVGAFNNDPDTEVMPEEYYEVSIEAVDGKLHMTGLLGNVYADPYCYEGTYNTTDNTVTFAVPTYYYYGYVMVSDYEYYLINEPFTLNVVEGEDGNLNFVKEDGWQFLYGWNWYYAGYTGAIEFVKDGKLPTVWNGNVLFPEATSIDDLLSCTVEFEGAELATASNHDVLGVIYDETGDPYAIAMGNEVYSVFGGVSSEANTVSVNFIKIAELNATLQASARNAAARIGGFQAEKGSAAVVFAGKSFKVDGQLVDEVIAHEYVFAGNGTTTGIDTIATEGNNATFDLSGRRVVNRTNGLYIVGGRKVIK